eukprot:COSAG03_NODE_6831_length_999_cov_1.253333_1_plen_182_part_10
MQRSRKMGVCCPGCEQAAPRQSPPTTTTNLATREPSSNCIIRARPGSPQRTTDRTNEMSCAIAIPTLPSQSSMGGRSSWSSVGSHGFIGALEWLPQADSELAMDASPQPLANLSSMGELPRLATQPSSFEIVTSDGTALTFPVPPAGIGEEDARSLIAEAFGLTHCAFVLRDEHGWVVCASA